MTFQTTEATTTPAKEETVIKMVPTTPSWADDEEDDDTNANERYDAGNGNGSIYVADPKGPRLQQEDPMASSPNHHLHEETSRMEPIAHRERPKLLLKPRSVSSSSTAASSSLLRGKAGSKPNPFGSARPREQVLKQRGIDASVQDSRIEAKVLSKRLAKYTSEQEEQMNSVQSELTDLELKLREANEKELPEESIRVQVEAKRDELGDLIKKFDEINKRDAEAPSTASPEGSAAEETSNTRNLAPTYGKSHGKTPSPSADAGKSNAGGSDEQRRHSASSFWDPPFRSANNQQQSQGDRRHSHEPYHSRQSGGGGGNQFRSFHHNHGYDGNQQQRQHYNQHHYHQHGYKEDARDNSNSRDDNNNYYDDEVDDEGRYSHTAHRRHNHGNNKYNRNYNSNQYYSHSRSDNGNGGGNKEDFSSFSSRNRQRRTYAS